MLGNKKNNENSDNTGAYVMNSSENIKLDKTNNNINILTVVLTYNIITGTIIIKIDIILKGVNIDK